MIITDVAAIGPDSLPQWLRPGVGSARTTVERFKDVESVIETDPDMWKGLLCDEYYRWKTVTEPLEQLIHSQREAESSPARARPGSPGLAKACLPAPRREARPHTSCQR